ncbi:MAG: sigma-54-dependent Fis family transcriptional regulator [Planctomycetes bacterium]|nr:sigma-54-dependent Fis family transcriptional regulator [Planctomycetota bacterium]
MSKLLVVDDEANVRYSLERSLESDRLQIVTAGTALKGIELVRREKPDAVILDIRLPDLSGLDAFNQIREIDPRLPVIVITAFATTDTAIEAMKRGAFEYLVKPVDLSQLREVVDKAVELSRWRHVPAVFEAEPLAGGERIVGQAAAMQEVYKAVGRVAPQDINVLILGETGTGKELVARAIFHHSRRHDKPYLAINCAAIPETLLESEMFGHERGAFTSADRRRIGKFEQANGGTIFLDEIGDMSSGVQSKVLRLLQEQQFERIGGNETLRTDVRIIAATNQDLESQVADGKFRKDLYYRLHDFTIRLPRLQDRLEDLPLLVEHFIKVFNQDLGKEVRSATPEAMKLLESHEWPGNVRELQSAIKYALLHASGGVLGADSLPDTVNPARNHAATPAVADTLDLVQLIRQLLAAGESDVYHKLVLAADRVALTEVLRHAKGSQVQASEILGISRTTLRAKMRAAGLAVEKHLLPDSGQAEQKLDIS